MPKVEFIGSVQKKGKPDFELAFSNSNCVWEVLRVTPRFVHAGNAQ